MTNQLIQWANSIASRKPAARLVRLEAFATRHGYPGWEDDMRHYFFCEEMVDAALSVAEFIIIRAGGKVPDLRRVDIKQIVSEYVGTVQEIYALWDVDRQKAILLDCMSDFYEVEMRRRGHGVPIVMLESYMRPFSVE